MNAKKSFWPYAIVLTFLIFLSGTATLIVIACTHQTDLITPNYYEEEIKFQTRLDQLNRTARFNGQITIGYDAGRECIRLSLPPAQCGPGTSGRIQLYRPSTTGLDRIMELQLDADGSQTLDAATLLPGLWKVRVQWTSHDQEFFADKSIVVKRGA
jgi:nitrogen fixation protein FixH